MACFADIDRPLNRQLGCAAYDVIWSIVAQSPTSCVWLIDAWFGFQPKEMLQKLMQQAGVEKVLEIWNQISPALAVERYARRLAQRRPGHPGEEYLPELALLAERAEPMRLGKVFQVDQQKSLDYEALNRWIAMQIP